MDEIRELMDKYNISVKRLARVSGYCNTYVYNCVKKDKKPSDSFLEDVREAISMIIESTSFTRLEMEVLKGMKRFIDKQRDNVFRTENKPDSMTEHEWLKLMEKLS